MLLSDVMPASVSHRKLYDFLLLCSFHFLVHVVLQLFCLSCFLSHSNYCLVLSTPIPVARLPIDCPLLVCLFDIATAYLPGFSWSMLAQAMREAKSGIYCGPLRLLAMEVFDSVNQQVGPHDTRCKHNLSVHNRCLGVAHMSCGVYTCKTGVLYDAAWFVLHMSCFADRSDSGEERRLSVGASNCVCLSCSRVIA